MLLKVLPLILFSSFSISLSVLGQGFSFYEYYPPEVYGEHPQNWDAEKDSIGYIYFGNGDGLVVFNGVEWLNMHIGETGRAQSLFLSKDGKMYVNGHSDFGLIIPDSLNRISYRSISDQFYAPNESKPYIWDVYEINGSIYNRHNHGVAIYDPLENTIRDFSLENYNGFMRSSFRKGDSIFVDSDVGLWSFQDSSFSKIANAGIFERLRLEFAIQLDDKSYLLGSVSNASPSRESYLHIYDGKNLQPFNTEANEYLDENRLFRGIKINDELIALATIYGGVVFIDMEGNVEKIFTERTGLYSNSVYNMYLSEENLLWLTLSEGIQKLDLNENILRYSEINGIEGAVRELEVVGDKKLVRTLEGIFTNITLKPEKVDQYVKLDLGDNTDVQGFFNYNDKLFLYGLNGVFQIGEENQLDLLYDKSVYKEILTETDSNERIFFTQDGLLKFDGNSFQEYEIQVSGNPIYAVQYDGDIYFVTGNRNIFRIKDHIVQEIEFEYDIDHSVRINVIDVIGDKLLVGAEGGGSNMGLFEFNPSNKAFIKSNFLEGYPDFNNKQVFNFRQCNNNNAWMIANKKLFLLKKVEGEWIPKDSPYQLANENTIYTMHCSGDEAWFGDNEGITNIKNAEWDYSTPFNTNITGVFIRSDSLIFGGLGKPNNEMVLSYKDNELRFTYAAASYIDPERNQYQVKLEGFEANWSDWTPETQKDYTNIPEGDYTFLARSKNIYDIEGSTASISFTILPPWYRTWWAYLFYAIAITGILYTAYKIRVNQLLRVERIRNNIASDLHDEVSATLSSISYFAEAIQSNKVKENKDRFVKLIANSAGDAKEKITDIVWAINPEHDDWRAFLSKCRRYASDLLESKGMKYSLKIDENIPGKLDMQLRQHLWLIFKEMVTNAVRHSEAGQLDVIINYEAGILKMVVQDDGNGMDVDQVRKGNGLVNIQKRADLIEGEISLKTSEGFGTRWILNVELR